MFLNFWNPSFEFWFKQLIFITMLITVFLTVISGISYMVNNKNLMFIGKEN